MPTHISRAIPFANLKRHCLKLWYNTTTLDIVSREIEQSSSLEHLAMETRVVEHLAPLLRSSLPSLKALHLHRELAVLPLQVKKDVLRLAPSLETFAQHHRLTNQIFYSVSDLRDPQGTLLPSLYGVCPNIRYHGFLIRQNDTNSATVHPYSPTIS
jgi:hypothetical protein